MRTAVRLSFLIPALFLLSVAAVEARAAKCDQTVTLSAEDYATIFGLDAATGFKSGACHDTTPCPSSYGACTNWSTGTSCGDPFCGFSLECGECNEWGQCLLGGPGTKQHWEVYRVCLNEQAQACTEYQRFSFLDFCGC